MEGRPIIATNGNLLKDLRQYEIEFLDGENDITTPNINADNLSN